MKVILISGKARSGKNQLAEYLKEYLDVDHKGAICNKTLIRGNAECVKEIAYSKYDWNGEKDSKGRQLLIDITNKGYAEDTYYWEKNTFLELISYKEFINKNCQFLIMPDWRYPQTLDYFKQVADNVITIKVTRPNLPKGTHEHHISENALESFNVQYKVENNKDLDNLKNIAKRIAKEI